VARSYYTSLPHSHIVSPALYQVKFQVYISCVLLSWLLTSVYTFLFPISSIPLHPIKEINRELSNALWQRFGIRAWSSNTYPLRLPTLLQLLFHIGTITFNQTLLLMRAGSDTSVSKLVSFYAIEFKFDFLCTQMFDGWSIRPNIIYNTDTHQQIETFVTIYKQKNTYTQTTIIRNKYI
jgi:hypothetical protein